MNHIIKTKSIFKCMFKLQITPNNVSKIILNIKVNKILYIFVNLYVLYIFCFLFQKIFL